MHERVARPRRSSAVLPALTVLLVVFPAAFLMADSITERALEAVRMRDNPLAIELLEQAVAETDDSEQRAQLELLLAHFYRRASRTDDAFRILLPLTESNPRLTASFPRQKIINLSVWGELAATYRLAGDTNAAILCWERRLREVSVGGPLGPVLNERRALAASGTLTVPPMVYTGYGFVPSQPVGETQRLLVPATKLAEALQLQVTPGDTPETITLAREGSASLTLTADSRVAVVNGGNTEMEVAPQAIEDELWVPLRFVAEAFAHTIEWEAPARIAWVR